MNKKYFQNQESLVSFTHLVKKELSQMSQNKSFYFHRGDIEEAIRNVFIEHDYELYKKTVYKKSILWRLSSIVFLCLQPFFFLIALFNWFVYGKWGISKNKRFGRIIDNWVEKINAKD